VWDLFVLVFSFFYTKDGNPEYAEILMFCKLDFYTFLPLLNSVKINPVVPNVLIFCQQNPFQQSMVLSKRSQEDFVLSLVSVAQL